MCYYKFGGFPSQHPALGTSGDPPSDGEKGRGMPGGSNDSMSVGEAMEKEENKAKKNRKTVSRRMGKAKMASGEENMGSSSSEEGGGAGEKISILFILLFA